VEHPPKFELMIDLTATMALGFEVPTACSSAPKILFAAVHESAVALFVRLESEMRAKAEVRQHAWVYKFTPRSDCR